MADRKFKDTEVGRIPVDWEVKRLGEIAEIATGSTPPTKDKTNYGDKYLFVSPADLRENKYVWNTEKKLSEKGFRLSRKFPPNTILFTCIGSTIGKTGILPIEATSNQQINAILPNESYSTEFVYYYLSHIALEIKALASEQAVPIINKSTFELIEILLPPLPEQKAIAKVLSDMDELIESIEKLIHKKKQIKQGAMQELLTGKKRLPGFSGKWEVKRLGEIVQIVNGGTPDTRNSLFWNGDIKWCTPTDITQCKGKYINDTEKKITKLGLDNSSATLLPIGTLLLCSRATIGEVRIANTEITTNQGFKSLICGNKVYNEYLYYYITQIKNKLVEKASGSTFLEVSTTVIKSIAIPLPPLPEQKAIAQILSDMDAEIEALEKKLDKYRKIKEGMMEKLLTGQVRLV